MFKFVTTAALLALSAAVQAETPINVGAPRTALVQVGDLSLSTAHGRLLLNRRIAVAIEEVCGSYAGVNEPSETNRIDGCRIAARRSAERQLAMRTTTLNLAAADRR